jgi:predicted RNA-binding Zn-ribbon protein involved in translation (DUF1610 family)
VTYNSPRIWQLNLAGLRPWLTLILMVCLASSLGLGWLLKSALLLIGLVIFLPILGILGVFWWSSRNVVRAACPVCDVELTGFNGTELDCPSCGEALMVKSGQLRRLALPNTIDIAAVEIENP